MVIAGAGVAAVGALAVGGAVIGASIASFGYVFSQVGRVMIYGSNETVVAKVRTDSGQILPVRRRHLAESTISRGTDGTLAIDLRYKNGQSHFEGPEAMRVASLVVPLINRFGGSRATVAAAVGEIEQVGGPERYVEQLTRRAEVVTAVRGRPHRFGRKGKPGKTGLYGLTTIDRLGLEMALHEDAERRNDIEHARNPGRRIAVGGHLERAQRIALAAERRRERVDQPGDDEDDQEGEEIREHGMHESADDADAE